MEDKKIKHVLEEEKETKRRELMFLEVLIIDPEDEMALYGLAQISYIQKLYSESIKYLHLVVKINPKYTSAYLLLGKCYEKIMQKEMAIEIYKKGIKVAANKGDKIKASEIETRLSRLST